jgi:hypothetical protein
MRIFLTGASGFLGMRALQYFRAEGHDVVGLARSDVSRAAIEATGAQFLQGDPARVTDYAATLATCDAVVHAAAPVEFWGPWRYFENAIVNASRDLLLAADRAGVKRFIYISSESVLQDRAPLLNIDESAPYPAKPNSVYGRAKKAAEQAILAAKVKTERIILRPTFIWGPGVKALDTMLQKVESGEFVWVDRGAALIEMVHVDNVAHAMFLALSRGRDGEIYYVTDDSPRSAREFLSALFAARGVDAPEKNLPGGLARAAATLVEGAWKLLRINRAPPLSRFELAFVNQPRSYRIDKIKREFGYQPITSFARGLAGLKSAT